MYIETLFRLNFYVKDHLTETLRTMLSSNSRSAVQKTCINEDWIGSYHAGSSE